MSRTAMESLTDEVLGNSAEEQEELTPTGRKKRGKNKWKRGELKAIRQEKKQRKLNEAKIEEITNQMHEVMLKIFRLTGTGQRGTPEHLGLREELHDLHEERAALGWSRETVITDEDRAAAKRYKSEKAKERKAKKEARSGHTIKRRAVKNDDDGDDDE